jgi:nucleotide-binding universal stress UspA family protein
MIYLAYDGSIHGDWVAWYAINLARNARPPTLRVVHVETPEIAAESRREALARLERECSAAEVAAEVTVCAEEGGVFRSLARQVDEGPENLLLCGTRARGRRQGFLSGTVSEKLLGDRRCNVVAVRVLQPGLFGVPHNLLLPLAGSAEGVERGAEILRLLAPEIRHLQLLRVMAVQHLLFPHLGPEQVARRLRQGERMLDEAEAVLTARLGLEEGMVDARVVVSDDWAHETVIAANRFRSQLICLDAARQSLTRRLFSGNPLEAVLRDAPCNVAVYRTVD